ncbi:histidine--tRNA ligase, partial [Striga asiatica]
PWSNKYIEGRGFHDGQSSTLRHINPLIAHRPKVKRVQQPSQHEMHHLQAEVVARADPPASAKWDQLEIRAPDIHILVSAQKSLRLEFQGIGAPHVRPRSLGYVVASYCAVLGKLTGAAKGACRIYQIADV